MKLRVNYKNRTVGYEGEVNDLTSSFVYLQVKEGHITGLSISACTPVWVEVPYYLANVVLTFREGEPDDHRWERVRNLAKIHVKSFKESTVSVGRYSRQPKPVLFAYVEKVST